MFAIIKFLRKKKFLMVKKIENNLSDETRRLDM